MEKINIAELLKDCPKGMELDCTMFEGLEFDGIVDNEFFPIRCCVKHSDGGYNVYNFTKYGCWLDTTSAKCVIFPKGKTTWEGFVPPIEFKDGDVVISTNNNIHLISCRYKNNGWESYCCIIYGKFDSTKTVDVFPARLATEEEKQKLFDAIKANGYQWNAETKTLEKLSKFKIGDKIKKKNSDNVHILEITAITPKTYIFRDGSFQYVEIIDEDYKLVPNKFDINTLVPFESKVLIRNDENKRWLPAFWGYKVVDGFITTFGWSKYCIPYKGNENLFKTNNDCDDFYKTWEK